MIFHARYPRQNATYKRVSSTRSLRHSGGELPFDRQCSRQTDRQTDNLDQRSHDVTLPSKFTQSCTTDQRACHDYVQQHPQRIASSSAICLHVHVTRLNLRSSALCIITHTTSNDGECGISAKIGVTRNFKKLSNYISAKIHAAHSHFLTATLV